jgi:hypothetical protein
MDDKILSILNTKLEEQRRELVNVVSDGGAKSYDHYKELCGTIRGLQIAQLEIGDLVRNIKDNDDD